MRVPRPLSLDFAELAQGVRRNNLGLAGMRVGVQARFETGRVHLQPTGQTFALEGPSPPDGWTRLEVLHWGEPDRTALRALP